MIARRSFLAGLGALLAAPAICQAESLMKVRGLVMPIASAPDLGLRGNDVLTFWMKRDSAEWEFVRLTQTDGWVNELPMPTSENAFYRGLAKDHYLEVCGHQLIARAA